MHRKLHTIWCALEPRHRRRFIYFTLLMLVVSCSEVLSVGAIFPFLALLAAPEKIFKYHIVQWVASKIGAEAPTELMLPLAITFAASSIVAGALRTLLIHGMNHFSFAVGSDLGVRVYDKILRLPYAVHVSSKSSEYINLITYKTKAMVEGLILPILFLINSMFMAILVCVAMAAINPLATLASILGFGSLYVGIYALARRSTVRCGREIAEQNAIVVKSVQDGLGGIRDIILDSSYGFYSHVFAEADQKLKKAQGQSNFILQSPRFAMESIGMAMIALMALLLAKGQGGISSVLPTLGAFALGAQRLLPVLHQTYSSISAMKANSRAADEIFELLNSTEGQIVDSTKDQISFDCEIVLRDVAFKYKEDLPLILSNVNLNIKRGAKVGIVGLSGSGKSTLIDIIMGLLEPTEGHFTVDGKRIDRRNLAAWRANISHVPQNIYLADVSIYENIAFGIPVGEIDKQRVYEAAKRAQIFDDIRRLPSGFDTVVGERGGRLSGGQRQRIGIARALYKKLPIIVLDEATSALDAATEAAVTASLFSLGDDVTLISISHRASTLSGCTELIQVDGGAIRCSNANLAIHA